MFNQLKLSREKIVLLFLLYLLSSNYAWSQEGDTTRIARLEQKSRLLEEAVKKLQNFKISGYVQAQYQYGEADASLKVGAKNDNLDKGFHRIGIRRGRIKMMYDGRFAAGTFQLDLTEKGINLKDAYLTLKDPWFHSGCLIKAGVFYRPFGDEISYSSSVRESPERTMLCQMLFPDERDLGLMLTLQAPATSAWHILKLEAGIFAGNGIKLETDSRTDFIGHLSVNKEFKNNIKLGGGLSYYYGNVYQGTEKVYIMRKKEYILSEEEGNKSQFAKREYMGVDVQFSVVSAAGMSQFRAEYLFGQQPASAADNKSPNASSLPSHDTYIRPFSGTYLLFVQDFGHVPLSAVLKYDWFDPNRKIAGSTIGAQLYSGAGDIAYHTFGFGLLWRATPNIRVQVYYDLIFNEKSSNLTDYNKDKKDNIFTLRLQYKF